MPASHYWGSGVLEWKVMTMKKRLASILFTSAAVAATVGLGVSTGFLRGMARPGAPWLADHDDRSEMSSDHPARVDFPASPDGRRSTSALGRSVIADALREADKSGALAAEHQAELLAGLAQAS